jgi:hypothetical protein
MTDCTRNSGDVGNRHRAAALLNQAGGRGDGDAEGQDDRHTEGLGPHLNEKEHRHQKQYQNRQHGDLEGDIEAEGQQDAREHRRRQSLRDALHELSEWPHHGRRDHQESGYDEGAHRFVDADARSPRGDHGRPRRRPGGHDGHPVAAREIEGRHGDGDAKGHHPGGRLVGVGPHGPSRLEHERHRPEKAHQGGAYGRRYD